MGSILPQIQSLLETHWGADYQLYDYQKLACQTLIQKQDALILLPTGAGKSLCFQLAGLYLKGLTVVISPLLALMEDQVLALQQRGVPAGYIHGQQTPQAQNALLKKMDTSPVFFLYLAPEQLERQKLKRFFQRQPPRLLVIDEAHCVSLWGQDFRPAYLRIPQWMDTLPQRPVVSAFTATAPVQMQQELISHLKLSAPWIYVDHPLGTHLGLHVQKLWTAASKKRRLMQKLETKTLIYVTTRQSAEDLCTEIQKTKPQAQYFHAGLPQQEKTRILERFKQDPQGIMVATKAFGMGIDISDIRQVIHWHWPENLESYVQEVGRAGRDRQQAEAYLLWQAFEPQPNAGFLKRLLPEKEVVYKLASAFESPTSVFVVQDRFGLSESQMNLMLGLLAPLGLTQEKSIGHLPNALTRAEKSTLWASCLAYKKSKAEQYKSLQRYVSSTGCRRQNIERYFGLVPRPECGLCDYCLRSTS